MAADDGLSGKFVPRLNIATISDNATLDQNRIRRLTQKFTEKYGLPPTLIACAPGRVNLIGEHIDYAGFAVLPMALERDIRIACAPLPGEDVSGSSTARVKLADVQADRYAEETFIIHGVSDDRPPVEICTSSWTSYGAIELAGQTRVQSMCMLVDGTIPPETGLSSSSALVVASAIATMAINRWSFSKQQLATMCAAAERYIGTNGGGMDQTCSIMAQPDHGLLIRFRPRLTTLPVKLPVNAAFVIFNSLATSQKAVSAEYRFNLRVVETQLAAYVLGYRLGIVSDLNISLNGTSKRYTWSLYDVARVWLEKKTGIAGQLACEQADALDSMLDVVKDILTLPSYTLDDVAAMTGNTTRQLHQKFLSRFPVRTDVFKLRERALHVYSEAARVCRFYTLCEEASASSSTTGYLKTLGQLMQESQRSCRELYECSCPELDILTKLCLQHGAYGARLTGAGWGGCCVALVDQVYAKTFVQRVAADYYQNYMGLSHLDISQLAFSCFAGRGAYLITF